MNDLYTKTINVDGQIYHYDPDRDIYYRYTELSPWDQWGWLAVTAILAVVAYLLSQ